VAEGRCRELINQGDRGDREETGETEQEKKDAIHHYKRQLFYTMPDVGFS